MNEIIIVGAGGHGRVVLDIIRAAGEFTPIGFLDGNPSLHGQKVDDLEVLGDISIIEVLKFKGVTNVIVAIGDNRIRRGYAQDIIDLGLNLVNAIHPSANIASTAYLGKNIVIAAGALVCAHCQIGNSTVLNTGCIVDHESVIANSAHICPGAKLAGRVIIDSGAFVGIGATIIQNVRIGTDAVVGAGAVVIKDVPAATTVVGIPARILKQPHLEPPVRFPPNFHADSLQEATR